MAAAITIMLWASSFVVIRAIGSDLSPGPIALARVFVAAIVLTPLVLHKRGPLLPRRTTFFKVAAYGLMWFAAYSVVLNAAEQHVDAGTAALLVNLSPLIIAIGAGTLLGEGLPRAVLIGCLVALVGVAVMSTGALGGDRLGLALGLLAAVLYGAAVLIQKVALRDIDGLRATWLGCVVALVVLLPFSGQLVSEASVAPVISVLGAVYLGVFPTAVAFNTWAYALHRIPAGRVGPLVMYLVTVVAVLFSWIFLGEGPTLATLVGGLICIVGVVIGQRGGRRHDDTD